MDRRFGLTILVAIVLVGAGIGAYVWQSGSGSSGSAQSDLDNLNRILVLQGEPTLPPGSDLSKGRVVATSAAAKPSAALASVTASPPSCGGTGVSGGQAIADQYGSVRGCGAYGTQMVFTTLGVPGKPGGIGTFQCESDDVDCIAGAQQLGVPGHQRERREPAAGRER